MPEVISRRDEWLIHFAPHHCDGIKGGSRKTGQLSGVNVAFTFCFQNLGRLLNCKNNCGTPRALNKISRVARRSLKLGSHTTLLSVSAYTISYSSTGYFRTPTTKFGSPTIRFRSPTISTPTGSFLRKTAFILLASAIFLFAGGRIS